MKIKKIIVEYGALIVPFLLALICIALVCAGSHQAILPTPYAAELSWGVPL